MLLVLHIFCNQVRSLIDDGEHRRIEHRDPSGTKSDECRLCRAVVQQLKAEKYVAVVDPGQDIDWLVLNFFSP